VNLVNLITVHNSKCQRIKCVETGTIPRYQLLNIKYLLPQNILHQSILDHSGYHSIVILMVIWTGFGVTINVIMSHYYIQQ